MIGFSIAGHIFIETWSSTTGETESHGKMQVTFGAGHHIHYYPRFRQQTTYFFHRLGAHYCSNSRYSSCRQFSCWLLSCLFIRTSNVFCVSPLLSNQFLYASFLQSYKQESLKRRSGRGGSFIGNRGSKPQLHAKGARSKAKRESQSDYSKAEFMKPPPGGGYVL